MAETLSKNLEKELRKINQQIETLKKNDPFADPEHVSDNAAVDTDVREEIGHDTIEAQIKTLQRRVDDIRLTLIRIGKGKYGRCEKCGKLIPPARLQLIPEAQYCIECERKLRK